MTSMRGDIISRVKRLPKPTKQTGALQPLFEAVSNALHAIEDAFGNDQVKLGRITIDVAGIANPLTAKIIISDNGVGLDDDRYTAFCTADTDYKIGRGGKGVGRLLWLDAFDRIEVESVFKKGAEFQVRSFKFQLDSKDQIVDEKIERVTDTKRKTGTKITFIGLRAGPYAAKFPNQAKQLRRHFGSHFLADFIMEKSPPIDLAIDGEPVSFPQEILQWLVHKRGAASIPTEDYGSLELASFVFDKEASVGFEGTHQLHFVANGRTVITKKIDGLLGLGRFGPEDGHVYHGCVMGSFLDERVNQERTYFNFEEKDADEIAKKCADAIRSGALGPEVKDFDGQRLDTMETFLKEYPSFHFDDSKSLLEQTPKNAVKAEQFAQALVATRIRRDEKRKEQVQEVVDALNAVGGVPKNFAEAVREAAAAVQAEERRQLTEYVLRRKMVLDVLLALTSRVKERVGKEDAHHLEGTLHRFICPMKLRGDDPSKVEAAEHDLWILDERLAFTRYFASDVPFSDLIGGSAGDHRPDILVFDKLHGLGLEGTEPLKQVMLVEFKRPGRRDYAERYAPQTQVTKYLNRIQNGDVESFDGRRIRIANDCVFYCFVVADIVGALKENVSTWRPTANGRGRILDLQGEFRGSIEIVEWIDLIEDARQRNLAFINAAGVR